MKIAHVLHPYQPDLGYQENYLPAKQCELGHDARIFTSDYVPVSDGENLQYEQGRHEYKSVPTYRLETTLNINSMGKVYLRNLWSGLSQFEPDVIHAHGLYSITTFQCVLYDLLNDVDLFVDVHVDNDNLHTDTLAKKLLYGGHRTLGMPFLVSRVQAFLPVNPQAQSFLLDKFDISEEQIELLPLGVNTDVFSLEASHSDLRVKLGYDSNEKIIITSGNINETKDIDVLVRAFEQIYQKHPESRLLVVGPCPAEYKTKMKELITDRNLEECTRFEGRVPHETLADYYAVADIGVWPGKLGITIIEAIGCGLPVIVCESDATSFLVANDNGMSFERGNVSGLVASAIKYLSDADARAKHSENALKYAVDHLSWEKISKKSINIYNSRGGT